MSNMQVPHADLGRGGRFQPAAMRLAGAFLLLAGLAACAGPTGPVVGDWRGEVPDSGVSQVVELVLDGTPDALSGRYEVATTTENTETGGGSGTERWAGVWRREQAADGRPVFHLLQDLSGSINRYELGTDNTLRVMGRGDRADTSLDAARYTLFPVPPGLGYGRA
jgi:hypothetical protein